MHITEELKHAKNVADYYPYRVGAGLAPAHEFCLPRPISLSCYLAPAHEFCLPRPSSLLRKEVFLDHVPFPVWP